MKTTKKIYMNRRNPNKYIEVHFDNYGHFSIRQFMFWGYVGVKNFTGDGFLHRIKKSNLDELLKDYWLYEYIH